jgi:hypothetical protein
VFVDSHATVPRRSPARADHGDKAQTGESAVLVEFDLHRKGCPLEHPGQRHHVVAGRLCEIRAIDPNERPCASQHCGPPRRQLVGRQSPAQGGIEVCPHLGPILRYDRVRHRKRHLGPHWLGLPNSDSPILPALCIQRSYSCYPGPQRRRVATHHSFIASLLLDWNPKLCATHLPPPSGRDP